MNRIISKEGLGQAISELADLQENKRPEIVKRIESAKALGDLSENAEYHDAKDQLQLTDTRISELSELIHSVTVVEKTEGGKVGLGSKVDVSVGKISKTFELVGASEADPVNGKVSNESPIGKALFGQKEDAEITIDTPLGKTLFIIKKVY
ncbi:MAG: transcription elongation factor GreA [bacterium]